MNYDEDFDLNGIFHLHELRHGCNLFGENEVAKSLKTTRERILQLYNSNLHGSIEVRGLLQKNDENFKNKFNSLVKQEEERQENFEEAVYKNEQLIDILEMKRLDFAGIGTNKAKRRLNKLSLVSPKAKAVRLALEVEDKNIQAKKVSRYYREKVYRQKSELIYRLKAIFDEQKWIYGFQNSDNAFINYVVYFEIPDCEQISWHTDEIRDFKPYSKQWDKKFNSTLDKLEVITKKLLEGNLK